MHQHKPTRYRVKKSLKEIVNKSEKPSANTETGTKNLSNSLTEATISKIDLNKVDGEGWYVRYEDGTAPEPVKIATESNVGWLPEGEIKNGFLYPTEKVIVNVSKDSNENGTITSTPMDIKNEDLEVGSFIIKKGSSKITLTDESVEINTPSLNNSEIKTMKEKIETSQNDIQSLNTSMNNILNLVYPIGSIYMSVNSVNPSNIFGGEWQQIEDKFLLASGSEHQGGTTGGEETHTLSESEMPTHKHDVSTVSSGGGTTDWESDHTHGVYYVTDNATGGSERRLGNSGAYNGSSASTLPAGGHSHSTPNHNHTISEANKGSSSPHNNMPPYLAVYVWKRTE